MTKRAKRVCKKLMGKGISRNAARLLIDEIQLCGGIRSVHNNPKRLGARFAALKLEEMDYVNSAMKKLLGEDDGGAVLPETGEDDG